MRRIALVILLLPTVLWADETILDEALEVPEPKSISSALRKQFVESRKSGSEASILSSAAQILGINSKDVETLNGLAIFYYNTKRLGMAKILLRRALKDHANEPALHNNMGIVFLSENEPRLALESFRKSIELKSSYRIGATNLAAIYLEHQDYSRSVSPLQQSYEATKADLGRGVDGAVAIANNYGVALMGIGGNRKAEGVFAAIENSGTRSPKPYLNYTILLTDVLNKKKDALRLISKLKSMTEDKEILKQVQILEKRLR